MSYTLQKFLGKITVTINSNDVIHWHEDNGGGGVALNTTIPAGEYYPVDLLTEVCQYMTARSAVAGDSITYTGALAAKTGIPTITASAGTFYLKISATEAGKLLTGGDVDVGKQGTQNLGWLVDTASTYPAAATSMSGDTAPGSCWFPAQPKATYDEGIIQSSAVEAVSMGGAVAAYDFSGLSDYLKTTAIGYQLLSGTDREQYEAHFFPYAKTGGKFKYYDDRSLASYVEMVLTEESLRTANFSRATPSLSRWDLPITMRKAKP